MLTVPTVLTTNRATAGEQSEQTADKQGFSSGAWWRVLSTLEYALLREERKAFFQYRSGLDFRRGGAKE